jgi:hypothetical protein
VVRRLLIGLRWKPKARLPVGIVTTYCAVLTKPPVNIHDIVTARIHLQKDRTGTQADTFGNCEESNNCSRLATIRMVPVIAKRLSSQWALVVPNPTSFLPCSILRLQLPKSVYRVMLLVAKKICR